jgi:YidC/Oxa1 family membrane protein insertase
MILGNVIESAFGPLISFFQAILLAVHSVVGGSWGWSIIGLTLLVRGVTAPLTIRQFKAMAQMRAHAPELDKIKKRYPDDKRRQQEETMKYFKEVGYNPLAPCLPLALQIPVFISLVYMLRTDLKKHICGAALTYHHILTSTAIAKAACNKLTTPVTVHGVTHLVSQPHIASFLFVNDITAKASGVVLVVLMVLYVGTMVFTSAMMSVGQSRQQRLMAIGLPVIFVIFVIQFPAGLLVYWIATNLTTIPQQYFNIRRYGRPSAAVAAAPAAATNGRGSSGAAKEAIKKPSPPPPSARPRKKRSGRRR